MKKKKDLFDDDEFEVREDSNNTGVDEEAEEHPVDLDNMEPPATLMTDEPPEEEISADPIAIIDDDEQPDDEIISSTDDKVTKDEGEIEDSIEEGESAKKSSNVVVKCAYCGEEVIGIDDLCPLCGNTLKSSADPTSAEGIRKIDDLEDPFSNYLYEQEDDANNAAIKGEQASLEENYDQLFDGLLLPSDKYANTDPDNTNI